MTKLERIILENQSLIMEGMIEIEKKFATVCGEIDNTSNLADAVSQTKSLLKNELTGRTRAELVRGLDDISLAQFIVSTTRTEAEDGEILWHDPYGRFLHSYAEAVERTILWLREDE